MPRRNPNIKRANTEIEFTPEQIMELKRCAQDPVYFIKRYVKTQHPVRGIVPLDLWDYQVDMVEAYRNHRYCVTLSARQTGKANGYSNKVFTPDGYKLMGDIRVGDDVLTPDGKAAKVLSKHEQGVQDIYRITFDDGSWADGHIDHLWKCFIQNRWDPSAANGHGGYVVQDYVMSTGELIEHFEKNKNRKNSKNYDIKFPVVERVNFTEKDLPIDPYLLGLLLGDGSISHQCVSMITKDPEIVEYCTDISSLYNCEFKPASDNQSSNGLEYRFKSYSKTNRLTQLLESCNLMGIESDTKFIPDIYLHSSHEQRLALLQGLMDTNGTVGGHENARTMLYYTTSPHLRDGVHQLVWSLGGKCSYHTRTPQNPNHKLVYDLHISLPNPKECFRLPQKRKLCDDTRRGGNEAETEIRRTVVDIKRVRREPAACITIDHPDHLYITDNFTVTHNTVTAAAYILWYAVFNFDKTILIAANKNSNAMEMVHRIRIAYENLPMFLKPGVTDDGWNKHSVGFDNGTRIISEATSENSGRGLSISLLYLDEFAFVAPNIQEQFWTSISPTLATGGSCIMTSTPNGDMDLYATIWRGAQVGTNGFYPIRVRWDQPPGRDEKFKEDQIGKIGERKWLQEYECEFLSSEALLINSLVLQNMTPRIEKNQPLSVVKDVVFWHEVTPGSTYLVGVDPATGSGEDFSVITVYEFPKLRQVAEYRSNSMSTNDMYTVLKNILKYLESKNTMVYFSVENNGVGEGIISLYEADESPPENAEFVSEEGKGKRGMTTTSRTKMRACVNLKEMIEKENMEITSPVLLTELKMFVRSRGAYAAQPGGTDDCVSATLIVVRLIEEIATYDQTAFDKLYAGEIEEWSDSDWDGYDGGYDDNDEGMPIAII